MTQPVSNDQTVPSGAIPVRLVNAAGTAFTNGSGGAPYSATPLGYSQITATSSAVGLGTIPTGATYCVIIIEAQSVRYRDDGTNPTTTVGMLLAAGTVLPLGGAAEMAAIKFIAVTAGAIVNVSFYS